MTFKPLKIGIIGGGQLGMYLAKAAKKQNIQPFIYSNTKDAPALKYAYKIFYGDFDDKKKLDNFFSKVDLITYEFESISAKSIAGIEKKNKIYPPINALKITQDREKEKKFFIKNNIKHAKTFFIKSDSDLNRLKSKIKFPLIIKTSRFGYDGKGQKVVSSLLDLRKSWQLLNKQPCVLEEKINLKKELSIIVCRDLDKNITYFPSFRNIHKNHILHKTYTPSGISKEIEIKLVKTSKIISEKLNYIGVLTVEFFIDDKNNIYVNEIAPRVHNSGHITQDTFNFDQFDMHIFAICGEIMPKLLRKNEGIMLNLIGTDINKAKKMSLNNSYSKFEKTKIYKYGKKIVKLDRKMGHINFFSKK